MAVLGAYINVMYGHPGNETHSHIPEPTGEKLLDLFATGSIHVPILRQVRRGVTY